MKYELAAQVYRMLYSVYSRRALQNKIVFLSRQSEKPSLDFRLLADSLEARLPGWEITMDCYRDDAMSAASASKRISRSFTQLKNVATSRLVITDGWNPAIAIPTLRKGTQVAQMWHAYGAIKQFGWQTVGKPAGRSVKQAQVLKMHRGYDVVISGGSGATAALAKAFDIDPGKIMPLGMPSMDYLLDNEPGSAYRAKLHKLMEQYPVLASDAPKVLYAPTFRKLEESKQALVQAAADLAEGFRNLPAELLIVNHPVFAELGEHTEVTVLKGAKSADILGAVDYVITDYSSVAFEAALMGVNVLFLCPDIEAYRKDNGLNIDLVKQFPDVAFTTASEVISYLSEHVETDDDGCANPFDEFAQGYLDLPRENVTESICDMLVSRLQL